MGGSQTLASFGKVHFRASTMTTQGRTQKNAEDRMKKGYRVMGQQKRRALCWITIVVSTETQKTRSSATEQDLSFKSLPSFLPSFPLDPRCFGCFPSLVSSPRLPRESSLCAWFAMLMLLCRACAHRRRFAAATRETEWPKKAGARRRRRRGAPRTGARGRGREGGSACLVSSARARVEIPGEGIG